MYSIHCVRVIKQKREDDSSVLYIHIFHRLLQLVIWIFGRNKKKKPERKDYDVRQYCFERHKLLWSEMLDNECIGVKNIIINVNNLISVFFQNIYILLNKNSRCGQKCWFKLFAAYVYRLILSMVSVYNWFMINWRERKKGVYHAKMILGGIDI
jgi:hypothetical protein